MIPLFISSDSDILMAILAVMKTECYVTVRCGVIAHIHITHVSIHLRRLAFYSNALGMSVIVGTVCGCVDYSSS